MDLTGLRKRGMLRVIFDLVCLACIGIPVLVMYLVANPYKRGFYCDDESIKHPYKKNTIPTWVAGFVGIALPSVSILIIEGAKVKQNKKSLAFYVKRCYGFFMPFFYGAAVCQLTTDIAKYTIGRLRPHFYTVCVPVIASCTSSTGYLEDESICTGTDVDAIREARLSFPSGHSSISFYCMVWYMVYLYFRFTWKRLWLLRPLMQTVSFFLAYYTGLSRISDYMHHWSDVLGGAIIGTVVALLNIYFVSDLCPKILPKCPECDTILPLYNTSPREPATVKNSEQHHDDEDHTRR